jgi:hypothetical protein
MMVIRVTAALQHENGEAKAAYQGVPAAAQHQPTTITSPRIAQKFHK